MRTLTLPDDTFSVYARLAASDGLTVSQYLDRAVRRPRVKPDPKAVAFRPRVRVYRQSLGPQAPEWLPVNTFTPRLYERPIGPPPPPPAYVRERRTRPILDLHRQGFSDRAISVRTGETVLFIATTRRDYGLPPNREKKETP